MSATRRILRNLAWSAAFGWGLLACGVATPPLDLDFRGTVVDGTTGAPVAGAVVTMTFPRCVMGESVCLKTERVVVAGPVQTDATGGFLVRAPNPDELDSLHVEHGGYVRASLPVTADRGRTINEHTISLERRKPAAPTAIFVKARTSGPGLELHVGVLVDSAAEQDLVTITRATSGALPSRPADGTVFVEGERHGDATVVYTGLLSQTSTDGDGFRRYVDLAADPLVATDFAVYVASPIGVYAHPAVGSWRP
jgi:hypothetical protein